MHDRVITSLFWDFEKNRASGFYRRFNQKPDRYPNINDYLNSRYKDSDSRIESLLRIVYNIENRPVCPLCGKPVKFIGKPNNKGIYTTHCSETCRRKDINTAKVKQTKLEKYGDANYNNIEKSRKTKLEKYGDECYNNVEKTKQTKLERYGDSGYNNVDMIMSTKSERYEDPTFNNRDKYKETCIEKYGQDHYMNHEKMVSTKIDKFGNAWGDPDKIKQTKKDRYGSENYVNIDKVKETKLERYGDENYNNIEKAKETCLERYGETSWSKSIIGKNTLSETLSSIEVKQKVYNTKKEHNSFNKSVKEEKSYNLLIKKYPDTIRQYSSDVYPFACDFYIPSLNLYIECNYSWTHGDYPYDGSDKAKQHVDEWYQKSIEKDSQYYLNAIETWTIRDVNKRETAMKNNLNWIEFFNIKELEAWLEKN